MWHFNATPALFKHVPRQRSLRLIYMLCFMYARRTVWNFVLPQTEYAVEKLTFLLPLSLPFFLSSNLTTFISPSYYLPFSISIFMALFSIHIYSSTPFFSISLFCFPCLPKNIAVKVKWLSFQLHVPSYNLDGSLAWIKEFCGNFSCVPVTNAVILTTARSNYQPSYYYVQQKALLSNEMWYKQIKNY